MLHQIGIYRPSHTVGHRIAPATVWWFERNANGFVTRSHAENPIV
jgi:hypothetical protein